jgi:hypothetical protein
MGVISTPLCGHTNLDAPQKKSRAQNVIQLWEKGNLMRFRRSDLFNPLYTNIEGDVQFSSKNGRYRSIEATGNEPKVLVHADNARPYIAKLSTQYFNEKRMKSASYPPYSPDLAPSDFYLFGSVKRCPAGLSFQDVDQLLAAVEGVLEGIEKLTLQAVFLEWMD